MSDAPPASAALPLETAVDLDAGLARFGHTAFRPGQREAVETLLHDGRLLLVAPTGGGKSLTYQLPATLLPGTTLVVSPLVSLMEDQVAGLKLVGVEATYLAATLGWDEMRARMDNMARGRYDLVYAAPERLTFPGFRSLLDRMNCPLIAIDEAHCISEWGHDFRPEYLQIGELLRRLPRSRVLACTATATPIVRDEILSRLDLAPDTPQIVRGFARPNLALRACEVRSKAERERAVNAVLSEALGGPGAARGTAIVYAPTRKTTEAEADRLNGLGYRVAPYHAGLSGVVRSESHRQFLEGEVDAVVATNAFGMGIDRPDVRTVVHLAPPGSMEAYYQEVGRAGRDGEDAVGLLLVSPGDLPLRRRLIESSTDGSVPSPEIVQHKWNLFLELMRWSEGGSCRHDAILRYFGDEDEILSGCGRCDVCLDLNAPNESDSEETSILVRTALSAVARLKGRYGLQTAAKLLLGKDDPRLEGAGLHETKTFGALSDRSEDWLTRLLRRCVTAGWVDFDGSDRPVVHVTEEGRAVLFGEKPVRLLLPPAASRREGRAPRRSGNAPRPDDGLSSADSELFDRLRQHRLEIARKEGVPPYVVASDRTLRDIARNRPQSGDELLMAHGIGPAKLEKYGAQLLAIVAGDGSS